MAETTDKKKSTKRSKGAESIKVETGPVKVEIEEVEGFTPEEVARMVKVKQAISRGRYTDITDEHKKFLFVRWLYEHNKLNS
ncbi:MAG TPA: hypothetical protein VJ183_08950 [Chloroflexia bacterium]|nr:hypothetical protein [Chloroflexia bacterium]